MNSVSELKPIAPKRQTRKTKCYSAKSDTSFDEKPDKRNESKDSDRRGNIVTATDNVTKQDSGDVDNDVTKYDRDSSSTLPNMKDHIACINNGDESAKCNIFPENDNLEKKKTCAADKIVVSLGDSLNNLTEKKIAMTSEEDYSEKTCAKGTNLETPFYLLDSQPLPMDLEHTKEEDGNRSCDKAGNTEDYPENLNPFADSTSDQADDGPETLDAIRFDDVRNTEQYSVRTTKARPSLYPWQPFAGETIQYKSHMIPVRQTVKTRASLYPWRPFGKEDYPEKLNPFSEIVQNNTNDDHDDSHLSKVLEEESRHPNIEQRLALYAPRNDKTSAQEITEEQDVPSRAEDDDVEIGTLKKVGRGKKILKTVRKKFGKFWDCVLCRR